MTAFLLERRKVVAGCSGTHCIIGSVNLLSVTLVVSRSIKNTMPETVEIITINTIYLYIL